VKTASPHVIGFDDAPFAPSHRGDVLLVGAVYAGARLEGILSGRVRRDGVNSTRVISSLVARSRFASHLRAVLLQGVTVAGFNVVDLQQLHRLLDLPIIAVTRQRPDLASIRNALLSKVPGGARKWRIIEKLGPMEAAGGVYIQRAGIEFESARALVGTLALNSRIPEPLRTAHLIAAGIARGESRHRV
jgi:endonuclease V-like protein UPF0215 family